MLGGTIGTPGPVILVSSESVSVDIQCSEDLNLYWNIADMFEPFDIVVAEDTAGDGFALLSGVLNKPMVRALVVRGVEWKRL